jgi:hypothetical protein
MQVPDGGRIPHGSAVQVRGSIARASVVDRCDAGALLPLASLSPRGHGVEKVEEVEVGAGRFRWWPRGFDEWLDFWDLVFW